MTSQPSPLFERVAAFNRSDHPTWIAFLWGFAEATLFFLVPDIFLGFVALFNWRKAISAVVAAVAGALVGGAIMFSLGAGNPQWMNQVLTVIPLIDQEMVDSVHESIHSSGVRALVIGPLQGFPYKIYAVEAGKQELPFLQFLLVTIPARLERFLPVILVGAAAGRLIRDLIRRRTVLVVGGYILFWLAVYTWYFLSFQ